MFIETKYIKDKDIRVQTPSGYATIEYIHKTKPLQTYILTYLLDGYCNQIKVGEYHVFIDINGKEIYAKDVTCATELQSTGTLKIIDIVKSDVASLYDISIDSEDELYYSQGILSHNSGKSITTAGYLT